MLCRDKMYNDKVCVRLRVCLFISVAVRIVCLLLRQVQSVLFDPLLNLLWFSFVGRLNHNSQPVSPSALPHVY